MADDSTHYSDFDLLCKRVRIRGIPRTIPISR